MSYHLKLYLDRQKKTYVSPDYVRLHGKLLKNPDWRSETVSWMWTCCQTRCRQVHYATVFAAINLFDRFLAAKPKETRVKLFALTALRLAVKLHEEERHSLSIRPRYFQSIASIAEQMDAEAELAQTLRWELSTPPTSLDFVMEAGKGTLQLSQRVVLHSMSTLIMVTTLDESLRFPPALLAYCALMFSLQRESPPAHTFVYLETKLAEMLECTSESAIQACRKLFAYVMEQHGDILM